MAVNGPELDSDQSCVSPLWEALIVNSRSTG